MKKNSLFKDSIAATLFILLSIYGLSKIELNSDIVTPLKALGDFRLTDIVFSHLRERPALDSNVVLVNIGSKQRDRDALARIINIINRYEPRVIGVDAFFRRPHATVLDSPLVEAFSHVKHLVLVSEMHENPETHIADSMSTSHPKFMKHAEVGFADMIAKSEDHFKVTRECTPKERVKRFYTWVDTTVEIEVQDFDEKIKIRKDTAIWKQVEKDTTYYSFPVKLAMIYAPEKAKAFLERNKEVEIINYQGNIDMRMEDVAENAKIALTALDCDQVEDTLFTPDTFRDKIVMIGYLGDEFRDNAWEDKFFTPLNANYIGKANPDMYGVVVHANIVSMILKQGYIDHMPGWLDLTLGLILIFINGWLFTYLYHRTELWYDGLTNLISLSQVLLLIVAVVVVFHYFNYIVDVTLPIVALLLTGNLIELHFGIVKPAVLKYGRKVPLINKISIFTND